MVSLNPIRIFKHEAEQEKGEMARMSNFIGAIAVGDLVKSTLGPKGMDKILVAAGARNRGKIEVTNDGATILKSVGFDNPAAKILVNMSKVQDDEVGDGTTSVTVLAAELLREAERLIERKIHPQTIIEGYRRSTNAALAALDKCAVDNSENDGAFRHDLLNIARTALSSKILNLHQEKFSKLAVDAVLRLKGSGNLSAIQVIKKTGGSLEDSFLDDGFLLDKKVGQFQPKRIENAKILIANTPMDTDKIKVFGSRIRVDSLAKVADLELAEKEKMKEKIDRILSHKCNVFINRQLIYNYPEQLFADAGVMAIEHADFDGIERLALVTGGEIVSTFDTPELVRLGECDLIEEVMIGEDKLLRFSGVKLGEACTIVIRGATQQIIDEAERSLHDALCVLVTTVRDKKTLYGGGCSEMIMARAVSDEATQLSLSHFTDLQSYNTTQHLLKFTQTKLVTLFQMNKVHRHKRGIINGLGSAINWLTGNMDAKDKEHYDNILQELERNEYHIQNNIKLQAKSNTNLINTMQHDIQILNANNQKMRGLINHIDSDERQQHLMELYNTLNYIYIRLNDIETTLDFCRLGVTHSSIMGQFDLTQINNVPLLTQNKEILWLTSKLTCLIKEGSLHLMISVPLKSNRLATFYFLQVPVTKQTHLITTLAPHSLLLRNNTDMYIGNCTYIVNTYYCRNIRKISNQCISNLFLGNSNFCTTTTIFVTPFLKYVEEIDLYLSYNTSVVHVSNKSTPVFLPTTALIKLENSEFLLESPTPMTYKVDANILLFNHSPDHIAMYNLTFQNLDLPTFNNITLEGLETFNVITSNIVHIVFYTFTLYLVCFHIISILMYYCKPKCLKLSITMQNSTLENSSIPLRVHHVNVPPGYSDPWKLPS